MDQTPLTEEQIANWRKALALTFGPYAFFMPVQQIELFRKRMQYYADAIPDEPDLPQEPLTCTCDPTKHGTTTHADGRITCNKCKKPRS